MNKRIFIAQISPSLNKKNLDQHVDLIRETKKNSLFDMIVFPELSLNGYNLQDATSENYYDLEELTVFKNLSNDLKIDIVIGLILNEGLDYFNSAIYFSQGEIFHIHKKAYLPNYGMFEEKRFFTPTNEYPKFQSFKTAKFGKTMVIICEDLWNAETIFEVQKQQLDMLIVISNSPARGFETKKDELEIEKKWKSILKTTAILGKTNVVFSNRVGFEDGIGFWGGSMLINRNGEVTKKLPLFDEVVE